MIPIRKMFVHSKKYKIKCPHDMQAEYITVHNTYNDASANNEIQYMINNSNQVSYHFAVDDKEIVQGIPLDRNAWHAGDGGKGTGNRKSIGIEICYSKSGGTKYYQAEGLAIQFIAQFLKKRGWGVDRVRKHQDWSGKKCPHRILDEGRWQSFLDAIEKEMKEESKLYEPNSKALLYSTEQVLKSLVNEGVISDMWLKKLENNELTESEASGLLYCVMERKFLR
jgi:N-acetylmuramoyl-L-alanine amidase